MTCPKCHQELADGARFCHRCGVQTISQAITEPHDAATLPILPQTRVDAVPPSLSTPSSDADPMIGRVLEAKYEILAKLGEGGMGTVYRARRVRIGDEVAVKVLHASAFADTAAVERFRREARAAAMLRHANVVTIHDYGEASGEDAPAFIVMELVSGTPLRDVLEREGRLAAPRAVSLMRAICAGIGAAHRSQIVHRDIKPDNIIVLPPQAEDEAETAKVLDFGIAKALDTSAGSLTRTGIVIGTPYYMSPEQCRAEELDARADVYSLGAMLYEMLAGRPPFDAATATGIVAKHLTEPPPRLPADVQVPEALEQIILRALAKDRQSRQSDANAMARELQQAIEEVAHHGALQPRREARAANWQHPPPNRMSAPPGQDNLAARGYAPAPVVAAQKSSSKVVWLALALLVVALGSLAGWYLLSNRRADSPNQNATVSLANGNQSANQNTATAMHTPTGIPPTAGVAPLPPDNLPTPSNANRNANRETEAPQTKAPAEEKAPARIASFEQAEAKIVSGARLTSADLDGLSKVALRLLRNTIYARHGRIFERPEIRRYFNYRAWYTPRREYRDSDLTAIDRANVDLILAAENQR